MHSGCQTNVTLFPHPPLLPHTLPQHLSHVPEILSLHQAGAQGGRRLHLHGNRIFFLPRHLRFTTEDTTSAQSPHSWLWGLTTSTVTAHVRGQLPLLGHFFKADYFM